MLVLVPGLVACAGAGKRGGAPPRDKVCAHVVEIIESEGAGEVSAELSEQVHSDCDSSLSALEARYAQLSNCLLTAQSVGAVADCEGPASTYDPLLRSLLSPKQALCVHIGELVAAASGGGDQVDMAACIAEFEGIEAQLGPAGYAEVERCMSATRSVDDFGVCESLLGPVNLPEDPERLTCEHVMDVLEAELEVGGEQSDEAARQEALMACIEGIRGERSRLGETGFSELVNCTLAAQDMAGVMRCNEMAR